MDRPEAAPAEEARPAAPADPVAALEARLGVQFRDRATAQAALTHKSYVNEHREEPGLADNERLEFLGDAVIDLAVSHRLMERFPEAREGELSKMRAAVVDEPGLCEVARSLDLGALLRLGRGEELTGGRQKASLLADALEAVVAAVFLESGLEPVLRIADRFLGDAFARATAGTLDRDFKTQLQEQAQSRLRATPRYRVVREHGPDHSKVFEVEAELRGEVLGRGSGRSKKDAEQAAARLALEALAQRAVEAATELGSADVSEPGAATAAAEPAPLPEPVPVPLPVPEVVPEPVPAPVPEAAAEPTAAPAVGGAATPKRRKAATSRPRKAPARQPARGKSGETAAARRKAPRRPGGKGARRRT